MFRRLEKEKIRTKNFVNWDNFTFNYKNKKIQLVLKDYPFKPPILLIEKDEKYEKDEKDHIDKKNHIDHIDWFLKEYIQFDHLKKFDLVNDCICCHTIICSWVPTYTIDQIIDEYKIYYDKYETLKSIQFFLHQHFFDDLVYEKIFLYIDI